LLPSNGDGQSNSSNSRVIDSRKLTHYLTLLSAATASVLLPTFLRGSGAEVVSMLGFSVHSTAIGGF